MYEVGVGVGVGTVEHSTGISAGGQILAMKSG
jgi:hypothetical protein